MEVKQHRVMNIKTGRVQVVTSQWLENAKQLGMMSDFELIGEVNPIPTKVIEDIPTIYTPKNENNAGEIIEQKTENQQIVKSKKGRKPKQK